IGYNKAVTASFNVTNVNITVPNLTVTDNSKSLQTVNITTTKPLIERKADRMVMNVENSILAAGNSAMEILERAPGVTIDKDDNISLKGKQGVTVMINDKLTYLSSTQLATLLRSTDGTTIESIELITNPSAKYDASGNSGIINIKLKKNKNAGTNGSVTLGTGMGYYFKDNTSVTLNHKEGNLNVFGNFSRNDNQRGRVIGIDRKVVDANGQATYFSQSTFMPQINHNNSYRFGADYDLSSKNTIGFIVNGYFNKENDFNTTPTHIGSTPAALDSLQRTTSTFRQSYNDFAANLNDRYQISKSGQVLTADLDYSKFTNTNNAQYQTDFYLPDGSVQHPSTFLRNQSPSTINIRTAKVDYTYPINKTLKFESGLKYSDVKTDNDLEAQKLAGSSYINDTSRTNRFVYDEKIAAGYINLSKEYKGTSIQLGLRGEYTNSTGDLITTSQIVNRKYFNLFPSVFINHTFSKDNELGLTYSRRIDRPSYEDLNPFVYYLDPYTFSQGNPFLKPQYTNSFELNYTYKKTINVSLGYSQTSDVITQIILTDPAKKVTYQTNLNLQTQNAYNININSPYTIAKWFTGNINLNAFYNQFKSDNLLGANLNKGQAAFAGRVTQAFLFGGFRAEVLENYQSAQTYGLFDIKPQYNIDLGLSRAFVDKKLNIKVSCSDIFNTRTNNVDLNYQSDMIRIKQKNESRIARLTLTYNFGNSKIKARNHQTGAEDEKGRVKGGN
ncbi:MAG TPA: outer membrane beta-barrel family protein, partial [Mucilaginibacter sp.]